MESAGLPFAHLNLRWNPFGEATRRQRTAMAVADVRPWVAHLGQRRSAVQFLGAHGRGKTSRLLALSRALPDAAYVRFGRGPVAPPPAGVWLLDEIGEAPRRVRRRLFASGTSLALATHVDLSDALSREGYRVQSVRVEGLTVAELGAICDRRVEWARRRPGPVPHVPEAALRRLIAACGDDVRAIEGRLYDLFQELAEPAHVEV